MVYARTIETKDHAFEVCPEENFTDKFFCSVFVFMMHHFCRYNRKGCLDDVHRRMKSQDRYVRAASLEEKRLLFLSMEKAAQENSLAELLRLLSSNN